MNKIFTFGSCISRDIFNHMNNEDFEVSLNLQRMSFFLLPTKGYDIKYEDIDIDYLDDFQWEVKMMINEVSKVDLDIAEKADADFIVMDLIEERFDYIEFAINGDIYRCIKSGHFENFYDKYLATKVDKGTYRTLSIDDYSDDEVKCNFDKCISRILNNISISKLILIETYYAQSMIDKNGKITKYENQDEIKQMNIRLKRVYRLMKEVLDKHCTENDRYNLIVAPNNTLGYTDHKWGPFPVHYTDKFYEDMANDIVNIVNNVR